MLACVCGRAQLVWTWVLRRSCFGVSTPSVLAVGVNRDVMVCVMIACGGHPLAMFTKRLCFLCCPVSVMWCAGGALRAFHGLASAHSAEPVPFSAVVDKAAPTLALTQVATPDPEAHAVYTSLAPRYFTRAHAPAHPLPVVVTLVLFVLLLCCDERAVPCRACAVSSCWCCGCRVL